MQTQATQSDTVTLNTTGETLVLLSCWTFHPGSWILGLPCHFPSLPHGCGICSSKMSVLVAVARVRAPSLSPPPEGYAPAEGPWPSVLLWAPKGTVLWVFVSPTQSRVHLELAETVGPSSAGCGDSLIRDSDSTGAVSKLWRVQGPLQMRETGGTEGQSSLGALYWGSYWSTVLRFPWKHFSEGPLGVLY